MDSPFLQASGTTCSSAVKFIAKQFENRYPPEKWNIYIFYFSDGENWSDDNQIFIDTIKNEFTPNRVNFTGIVQVLSYFYQDSVKWHVDEAIKKGELDAEYVRTVTIGSESQSGDSYQAPTLTEDQRNQQILDGIKKLLGGSAIKAGSESGEEI